MIRALVLLSMAIGASVWATYAFGQDVLFALGLIFVQIKVLGQKLITLKPALMLAWLKAHALVFVKKDVPYKWVSSVLLPLVMGKAFFRRIGQIVQRLTRPIAERRARLMAWYAGRTGAEKVLLTLTLVSVTLALSVTTVGLWLVLFSVTLPLWLVSILLTLINVTLRSVEKYIFKLLAFLHLKWVGRMALRLLPASWVARKRRFDYRVARAVVRQRRLTIRQVAERKDNLPFRIGLMLTYVFGGTSGKDNAP